MPQESPKMGAGSPTPQNSVRLDAAKLQRFLTEREAAKPQAGIAPRRDYVRWSFQALSIPLTINHASGSHTLIHVACRDLSSGGIGVLHSAYMHVGTACSVALRANYGRMVSIEGRIVRCAHVSGTIHEVGIKFTTPIDPKQFVELDPFANGFSLETVSADKLRGTVLYLEDSALDQSLVRHFLRETQIELIVVKSVAEAIEHVPQVDLVLCDYHLEGECGARFVSQAREMGMAQPILMVTADTSASTRQAMIKASASAFVTKPVQKETLFRALAEFMMLTPDASGVCSTLPHGHSNESLLESFVDQIKDMAAQISLAMEAGDAERARSLCLQIVGSAPVMGFDTLANLAKTAEKAIASTMSLQESGTALRTLIAGCARTTARRAG